MLYDIAYIRNRNFNFALQESVSLSKFSIKGSRPKSDFRWRWDKIFPDKTSKMKKMGNRILYVKFVVASPNFFYKVRERI